MKVHWLITFFVCAEFHKAGVAAFDLDTASSFLLDVFNVRTSMTHHLGSKIEAWNGFEIDRNSFFRPFSPSKFISLDWVRLSSSKASLVNQVWQFLLHKLIDLFNRLLEAYFRRARNVKVEWRILNFVKH